MSHGILRRACAAAVTTALLGAAGAAMAPSAMAISSDYCGYGRAAGEPFCFEGSGYRGWRYHQASTGSQGPLVNLCVRAYTNQGNYYRVNACSGGGANFISRQYCNADPSTNSSVGWFGSGTITIFGHADSRTCGFAAASSGELPNYVSDSLQDPSTAPAVGASPSSARNVASSGGRQVFTLAGDQQRCVLSVGADGFGASCTTAEALSKAGGQQLVVDEHDGTFEVFGLVGGTKATVATADGARRAVAVSGAGATSATFKSRPTSVTVESSRGTTTSQLGT